MHMHAQRSFLQTFTAAAGGRTVDKLLGRNSSDKLYSHANLTPHVFVGFVMDVEAAQINAITHFALSVVKNIAVWLLTYRT